jgi:dihydrofolate reductase
MASLDGYIAREDGSVDWLENHPNPQGLDYGYADFVAGIDTVLIGRKSYEEILGFDLPWPYADCQTYVFTSDTGYEVKTVNTRTLTGLTHESITQVREKSQKSIWLLGGGKLVTAFLNLGAIDEIHLFIIPVILGKGIPLFPNEPKESTFTLTKTEAYENGVVGLFYRLRT